MVFIQDWNGKRLGNYRLGKLLGKGGFAEVYLGEHIYLKTQAAVKILQAPLLNTEDQEDFLREAQTVARLAHPHIVRILDFGVNTQTPYLAMELCPRWNVAKAPSTGRASGTCNSRSVCATGRGGIALYP